MRVTLDEVARVSGVSRATASRAINDHPNVSDDVRDRVRAVATTLGYRPNRAAKNLAGGHSSVIGLVLPTDSLHNEPYTASIIQYVAHALDRRDRALMLMLSNDAPSRVVAKTLRDGLVDGVIASNRGIQQEWVHELLDTEIPTVVIGSHEIDRDVHTVQMDHCEPTIAAVRHLYDQGCRKMAHIKGPPDHADARLREAAFRLAHQQLGLRLDPALVVDGNFQINAATAAMTELLVHKPDGVVAANDRTAIGAIRAIHAAGLRVPDDIAVTGFDGLAFDHVPSITSVVQPISEMADLAVTTLIGVISGTDLPMSQMVEAELVIAESSVRITE